MKIHNIKNKVKTVIRNVSEEIMYTVQKTKRRFANNIPMVKLKLLRLSPNNIDTFAKQHILENFYKDVDTQIWCLESQMYVNESFQEEGMLRIKAALDKLNTSIINNSVALVGDDDSRLLIKSELLHDLYQECRTFYKLWDMEIYLFRDCWEKQCANEQLVPIVQDLVGKTIFILQDLQEYIKHRSKNIAISNIADRLEKIILCLDELLLFVQDKGERDPSIVYQRMRYGLPKVVDDIRQLCLFIQDQIECTEGRVFLQIKQQLEISCAEIENLSDLQYWDSQLASDDFAGRMHSNIMYLLVNE